jgi:outer membrane cobalamin receptor
LKYFNLRSAVIYILVLLTVPIKAQYSFNEDTVRINEVVISRKKLTSDLSGYKTERIDSSILKDYSNLTLAEVLSENSNILIKSYGMGGTATTSFRGTGAGHTQVAWNGINLNNPMLGQSDLSLITTGLIDDITLYFGGASMSLNSGGIGGIINLETRPKWKKETVISLNAGTGSFGNYSGLVKVKSGNIKLQTITRAVFLTSENNYRYLNSVAGAEPVWQTRNNSQVRQKGFIQELYLKGINSVVSARIWYQSANRNLPASMLTEHSNSDERQFDESLRTVLNYDIFKGINNFTFTAAWIVNRLNYFNRLASIDSRNLSDIYSIKSLIDRRVGEYTRIRLAFDNELNVINTNNYDHTVKRNISSLTVSVQHEITSMISTSVLLREILNKNKLLIPDFSTGLQFRLTEKQEYYVKVNISRNSKIPTMNDLFWIPGGNPDLRNEFAYVYELSYVMKQQLFSSFSMNYDLTLYRNKIKDMIQWHPGEFSFWTADNIQSVYSAGLESSISVDYSSDHFKARLKAGYSLTRATNKSSIYNSDAVKGKQLIYIPENQANAKLSLMYRNIYTSWTANMIGKRFTTVDNSSFLPGYFINSVSSGIKLNIKGITFDTNLSIDNIFNVNYQTIAYYPLPGCYYTLKILVQIIK